MGEGHSPDLNTQIRVAKDFIEHCPVQKQCDLTRDQVADIYGETGGPRIYAGFEKGNTRSKFLKLADFIADNYRNLKIGSLAKAVNAKNVTSKQLQKSAVGDSRSAPAIVDSAHSQLRPLTTNTHSADAPFGAGYMRTQTRPPCHNRDGAVTKKTSATADTCISHLSGRSSAETNASGFRPSSNNLIDNGDRQTLDNFRYMCGKKATEYLKKNENTIDKIKNGKYKDKENKKCNKVYKIFFACLVAVASTEKKHQKIGFNSFSKIKNAV